VESRTPTRRSIETKSWIDDLAPDDLKEEIKIKESKSLTAPLMHDILGQ
jgi:hypothetical protein